MGICPACGSPHPRTLAAGCQVSSPDWWDEAMELVKPGYVGPKHETAHSINNELRTIKDQMDLVFKYFEVNEIIPTPSEVNKKYKERMSGIAPRKPGSAQSDPNRSKSDPNHLLNSAFVEKVFLLIKEDHRVSRKTIAER